MSELALELDEQARNSISGLMSHYRVVSAADIISKALTILSIAAHVEKTDGELFARKGTHETKIVIR